MSHRYHHLYLLQVVLRVLGQQGRGKEDLVEGFDLEGDLEELVEEFVVQVEPKLEEDSLLGEMVKLPEEGIPWVEVGAEMCSLVVVHLVGFVLRPGIW